MPPVRVVIIHFIANLRRIDSGSFLDQSCNSVSPRALVLDSRSPVLRSPLALSLSFSRGTNCKSAKCRAGTEAHACIYQATAVCALRIADDPRCRKWRHQCCTTPCKKAKKEERKTRRRERDGEEELQLCRKSEEDVVLSLSFLVSLEPECRILPRL